MGRSVALVVRNEQPSGKSHGRCGVRILAQAVQQWYVFYEVAPDQRASSVLSSAALHLFHDGYSTVEDIATALMGRYVGIWSTRVNARASESVH